MSTLLEIAQNVADEVGFQPGPTQLIGQSEETYRRLLRAVQKGGEMTARAHDWSILQTEYTFSTALGDPSYDLPAGVRHLLADTAWNRTQYWSMRGSLSPSEWQIRKSAMGSQVGLRNRYRIRLGTASKTIEIDPVPGAVETLVIEYVTNNWIAGLTKNKFTLDTDTPDIDPWLVELAGLWLFKRSIGEPYADEESDWERETDKAFTKDAPPGMVSFGCSAGDAVYPTANVPDSGFGA